jgi:hypothetical protein
MSLLLEFELFRRNTFVVGASGPHPNKRMTCHGGKKQTVQFNGRYIQVIELKKKRINGNCGCGTYRYN